jgi:hypothetical protein
VTSVGQPTAGDRRWQALADELAPAKSLQRLDAASGRIITALSIVAPVLTGFSLLAAGLTNLSGWSRLLASLAAGAAIAALVVALRSQAVTVSRDLNLDNVLEVEQWYDAQFDRRTRLARWATGLLVAAVALAGVAALVSLTLGPHEAPTFAVARTADTVTADVTVRGLDPEQVANASVAVDRQVVAVAAFGPNPDGVATRSISATRVAPTAAVDVTVVAGPHTCTAALAPDAAPTATCRRS